MQVYVLYRDLRTYGEREDLYTKAREMGVVFIRFNLQPSRRWSRKAGSFGWK